MKYENEEWIVIQKGHAFKLHNKFIHLVAQEKGENTAYSFPSGKAHKIKHPDEIKVRCDSPYGYHTSLINLKDGFCFPAIRKINEKTNALLENIRKKKEEIAKEEQDILKNAWEESNEFLTLDKSIELVDEKFKNAVKERIDRIIKRKYEEVKT